MKTKTRAVLLDLDGTLYIAEQWLPKSLETIEWLMHNNFQIRFVTNTTMENRRQLQKRFIDARIDFPTDWFFTPARAAFRWFKTAGDKAGILPLVHPNLLEDLEGLPLIYGDEVPFVLVGDMDDTWNISILNQALRALLSGAKLTALHKNRYWMAADGYRLTTGAFVSALEYGANTNCEVIFGKPTQVFFDMILRDIGVAASETIMVGDDLESDVLGAQRFGIRGVLVKTGKFRQQQLSQISEQSIVALDNISYLPSLLEKDESG